MQRTTIAAILICTLMSCSTAWAEYTQGFEGSGYNFYADTGCFSGLSATVAHSGSQSAQFTLNDAQFAYTRWKSEDISSYGFTVKDVAASDWAMRTLGRSDLSPYLLFTIQTPDTSQETLAIQFSMAAMTDNVWTENVIDRAVTTFHVNGDRTGLGATEFSPSGTQGTLNALADRIYSGTTKWGDFPVTYVRVGVGLWDASQAWNGYVDDVTVTPEPASMSLLLLGGLLGLARRKRT